MTSNKELTLKKAALSYLKKFGIWDACSRSFEEKGHIWCSEMCFVSFNGSRPVQMSILYDTALSGYTYREEAQKAIQTVRDAGLFPYHIIRTESEFGTIYAVLYLDLDEEGIYGEPDYLDEEYGYRVPSYAYNADDPRMSDFGEICVKLHTASGGMLRTC